MIKPDAEKKVKKLFNKLSREEQLEYIKRLQALCRDSKKSNKET